MITSKEAVEIFKQKNREDVIKYVEALLEIEINKEEAVRKELSDTYTRIYTLKNMIKCFEVEKDELKEDKGE